MRLKVKLALAILLVVQIFGLRLLRYIPDVVEKYYSLGIFQFFSTLSRYIFGWIPFSVGDLMYLGLIIYAIRWLYLNIRRLRTGPAEFFLDIAAAFSLAYLLFNLMWGFNYYRNPLYKTLALDPTYETQQLLDLTQRMIAKSNTLHRELGYADSVKIDLPYSQKEIFQKSIAGYEVLAQKHPMFSYKPRSVKKSGLSLGLTYMGYSGYYNPFTGEAQVNNLIKSYKFPVVACHEEAHQMGYAAENEANFIAALATINNPDTYIKYSGYIFMLRYCINEIARRDEAAYRALLPTINDGILESYREMREFWASYNNPFEDLSKAFWDNFLKANNQSKGIMSYSYMVALVVNYFDENPL